jgi:hypothetical protein
MSQKPSSKRCVTGIGPVGRLRKYARAQGEAMPVDRSA